MNREQAKIIGQMSDGQLEAVGCAVYVKHKEAIIAFGNGAHLEYKLSGDNVWMCCKNPQFRYDNDYRIVTPKITFNGVEIDAPIKDAYSIADGGTVWALGFCSATCKLEPKPIGRSQAVYVLKGTMAGICWKTYEACQLYCDTHNKMMGVSND
jgi:hypothetical protein